MIRDATSADIPAILEMADDLRQVTRMPQELDYAHAGDFLVGVMLGGGLALVVDVDGPCGFLVAAVGRSSINPEPVAVEHGWYCREPGWGGKLLRRLEAWAHEQGCAAVKMSTAYDRGRYDRGRASGVLRRAGYAPAEVAWVKRL